MPSDPRRRAIAAILDACEKVFVGCLLALTIGISVYTLGEAVHAFNL